MRVDRVANIQGCEWDWTLGQATDITLGSVGV